MPNRGVLVHAGYLFDTVKTRIMDYTIGLIKIRK
jgi:hypothetical protein